MEIDRPENLMDVDSLIKEFLKKHEQGIITMHNIYYHNDDKLSIRSLIEELMEELRTGCVTFLNKDDSPISELNPYLFYIVNAYCKTKASKKVKKITEYLCPGCLFLGENSYVMPINKFLRCDSCEKELRNSKDPKKISLFRMFFKHNKNGYHCTDCERFIPHPIDDSPIISCPYLDCCFVGTWSNLKRMHHPSLQSNAEMLILDGSKDGKSYFKNVIPDSAMNPQIQLECQEALNDKIKLLSEVIDSQKSSIPYNSSEFTAIHKFLVYQSFALLLKRQPEEMVDYLLNGSRSGGFQHKIFQEYIKFLEEALPFSFKKNNKLCKIESLLDDNLNLFDGISIFEATINDKLCIKNNTKEFYIGGRKASYTKPYYLGKILSISEKNTKKSLLDNVTEYSFSKIKLKNISPGTNVIVTHLRIPPHYEMGGMVHVNRVRKKIVDRAHLLLNKGTND